MKKFLSLLLVLVMSVATLASCSFLSGLLGGDEEKVPLSDAEAYLYNMYKDNEGKETPRDYNVVAKVIIEDVTFTVTWTSDNAKVKVVESTKDGFWTIDVPASNEAEFTYKLTATITNAAGETVSKEFNRKMPVVEFSAMATEPVAETPYKLHLYQGNKSQDLFATHEIDSGKFLVSTNDAKLAPDFYAEIVDGGYKFYTMIDGAKMYLNAYLVEEEDGPSKRLNYTETTTNVWTYKSETNGWYVTLSDAEYVLGTYGSYTTFCMSESRHLTAANSGVSQFVGGFMDKTYAESLTPDEEQAKQIPQMTGATEPAVGTAYTLGFVQGNKDNAVYYVTGVLGGYNNLYMATTKTVTEAANFYIEETEGGYSLYCIVAGTRQYLNMVVSGKYINAKYQTEAATVYTYDATLKTLVSEIDGTKYMFGTSATNTYDTIGPVKANNENFYAQFVVSTNEDQDEAPAITTTTIANIIAGEDGKYQAEGVVVAALAQAFILKDDTGSILVYKGGSWTCDVAVGDKLTVVGTSSVFGNAKQLGTDSTYTKTGTDDTFAQPTPVELTTAQIDAYATNTSITPLYVKVTGTLSIASGKFFNVAIEGATLTGSLVYLSGDLKEDVTALNGKIIDVVGYVVTTSKSGDAVKYLNIMITSATEHVTVLTDAEKVAAEKAALTVSETALGGQSLTLAAKGATHEDVVITWAAGTGATVEGSTVTIGTCTEDFTLTLTATLTLNDATETKEFTVAVTANEEPLPTDAEMVAAEKAALTLAETANAGETLTLAANGATHNGVAITWAVTEGKASVGENGLYIKNVLANGTVKVTATITSNAVSDTKEFTVAVTALDATVAANIVKAAYDLDAGETLGEYTLTGVITKVDTAYDTGYHNITVTIVVDGLTDSPIQCYRLKGDGAMIIDVDDTVTVNGTIKNYKGTIEFDQGCTITSYVAERTDAEKVALEKKYLSVNTSYNANGTETLPTNGNVYGEATTITWALTENAAATLVDNVLTITQQAEATTVTLTATIKVGEATENVVFEISVDAKLAEGSVQITKTAAEINTITTVTNDATVALDSSVSLTFTKGDGTSNPTFNTNASEIRLYQAGSGKTSGNVMTVTCVEGKTMSKITLTCTESYAGNGYMVVEGGTVELSEDGTVVTITVNADASSVKIYSSSDNKTNRIYIKSLSVVYS